MSFITTFLGVNSGAFDLKTFALLVTTGPAWATVTVVAVDTEAAFAYVTPDLVFDPEAGTVVTTELEETRGLVITGVLTTVAAFGAVELGVVVVTVAVVVVVVTAGILKAGTGGGPPRLMSSLDLVFSLCLALFGVLAFSRLGLAFILYFPRGKIRTRCRRLRTR